MPQSETTAETPPEPSAAPMHDAAPSPSPGWFRRALWWAAGCDERVLREPGCRVDWNRCSAIGAATLATAAVASLTGSLVADFFLFDRALVPALLAGAAWGGLILTFDRVLLCSVLKQPRPAPGSLFWTAAPRYALAVLIALAVGVPAELVVFRRQLDVQVAVDHQDEVARQRVRLIARYADIEALEARSEALTGAVDAAQIDASATFRDAACEGVGDCGSDRPGLGPLHAEKLARFADLQRRADALRAEDAPQVRALTAQIAAREAARERDLGRFEDLTRDADDLMTRLLALQRLARDPERGAIVRQAEWVIRLLVLALEILPLTAKLFTRGAYDAAYLAAQDIAKANFDADRLVGAERAQQRLTREQVVGREARRASEELARNASAEAMTSQDWREAQDAIGRDILDRAVGVARRAAAEVFEDEALRRDVTAAGVAARRAADADVVATERDHARAAAGLNGALADADALIRH